MGSMKKTSLLVVAALLVACLVTVALVLFVGRGAPSPDDADARAPATPPTSSASDQTVDQTADQATAQTSDEVDGFLYGRITSEDGTVYQGRLRFGGDEEAFWSDSFNGRKVENPWAAHVSPERLVERRPVEIFGIELTHRERTIDLVRPFMARFGDIDRIEVQGRDILVTLESGTVFTLDRFADDDLADGLRVWDERRGVVDLGEGRIQVVEFLPTPRLDAAPNRLHGTVRTARGDFTGFVQWNRKACVGTDEIAGHDPEGELLGLRFDAIRSITKTSLEGSRVTLRDGREIMLSGTRDVAAAGFSGPTHGGVSVDDPRYGRVLVSWRAFQSVDFGPPAGDSPAGDSPGSGSGFDDFPPGRKLTGRVTTRDGRRLEGRLVYDLDESETTETLDAPWGGVSYQLPFGSIASIEPNGGKVTLHHGEALQLERRGDLGEQNAGLLVFVDGREPPEYVRWIEVERIDLDRPPAT